MALTEQDCSVSRDTESHTLEVQEACLHYLAQLRQLPSGCRPLGALALGSCRQLAMLQPHLLKQLHQILLGNGEGGGYCQAAHVKVYSLQVLALMRCQDSPLVVGIASCNPEPCGDSLV